MKQKFERWQLELEEEWAQGDNLRPANATLLDEIRNMQARLQTMEQAQRRGANMGDLSDREEEPQKKRYSLKRDWSEQSWELVQSTFLALKDCWMIVSRSRFRWS